MSGVDRGWRRIGVLLAALSGLLWLTRWTPEAPKGSPPLVAQGAKAIDHLVLDNGEHLEFHRQHSIWSLQQPFEAPVSQSRLAALLEVTQIIPRHCYPRPEPKALKDFRLDPEVVRLTVGATILLFGGTAPLDRSRYVLLEDRLCLVEDDFFHALTARATDFVDKKLLGGDPQIHRLELPGLAIHRTADGQWSGTVALDEAARSDLITRWRLARAVEVRRETHAHWLGESVVIGTDQGMVRFQILAKSPELVFYREDLGLAYVLGPESARLLLERPEGDSSLEEGQPSSEPSASTP